MSAPGAIETFVSSAELAARLRAVDYSQHTATVVGYGNMGKQYVKALQALGVGHIRVCSRSNASLAELQSLSGVTVVSGGYEHFENQAAPNELGIVATPTDKLIAAAAHLANLGYRKILVEKPVALRATPIEEIADAFVRKGVDAVCAYNRLAYPSFHEVRARVHEDGGVTSCTYTFTEFVHRIGPDHFPLEELQRWGVANSLHVLSMAHGLIGLPERWSGHRTGAISWHPTGAVFVGSGISVRNIPFAYHADWGSKGRWSVEVHTRKASYRLCPLENAFMKSSAPADWEEIPLVVMAPHIKAGFLEQVATMLMAPSERPINLPGLNEVAALTRYAEQLFGYAE